MRPKRHPRRGEGDSSVVAFARYDPGDGTATETAVGVLPSPGAEAAAFGCDLGASPPRRGA